MLKIPGRAFRYCDGVSRRSFLTIGTLGMGGLALPQLLEAEATSGVGKSDKSIIMIYLPGGPPHQDLVDLKMDAPSEIRGPFRPIATNVGGIQISELLPQMARVMDKMTLIRSMSDAVDDHSNFHCFTGRKKRNQPPGGWPAFGSVVSKLMGSKHPALPPFIGMEPRMQHRPYNEATPGFLGPGHQSFRPEGQGKSDMVLQGVTLDRLEDRRTLLSSFDRLRHELDTSGMMEGLDVFKQQAFGVLTRNSLVEALDLSRESEKIRERYGKGDERVHGDAAPMLNQQFLAARRLVERGARVVTVAYGFWDYHGANHENARKDAPLLDQGVSALIEDLYERGLDRNVAVVIWGEFGRTPTVNSGGGRDHWPRASFTLLSGGGFKTGQVIGSTDRLGGEPDSRPVRFGEVFASLYHHMGIDVATTTVQDLAGRPQYLVDDGCAPLPELVG
ncbi:MAG: DUF1501 domain-containing protein [Verrucomicrobia bacterium]|nr:DUF1501 domain-containing protein [Verrucomicrobiota bacterium]